MLLSSSSSLKSKHNNDPGNLVPHPRQGRRGAFVVLEGLDRSGKTTQCKLLWQRLLQAGIAASCIKFPNRTTATGRIINDYLQSQQNLDDRAIHLLFSANRWEATHDLTKTLYDGTTIICDRYAYSGVAFSSAKVKSGATSDKENMARDGVDRNSDSEPVMSLDWCQAPDRGLPAPDCVIFLQLSPEQAESRGGYGEERYEKRDMQLRVRQRFAELQRMDEQQRAKSGDSSDPKATTASRVPAWYVIDAAQSMEDVHAQVWNAIQSSTSFSEDGTMSEPLGKLWEAGYCSRHEEVKEEDKDESI